MSQAHVTHIGTPFAPIAAILDAHLPAPGHWRVQWDGDYAYVSHDDSEANFSVVNGRAFGPYWATGLLPEVVMAGFTAVRGPLIDRLTAKMCGAGQ